MAKNYFEAEVTFKELLLSSFVAGNARINFANQIISLINFFWISEL